MQTVDKDMDKISREKTNTKALFFTTWLHLQTKADRGVAGPVLLGDVTGVELENTVTHSHGLLCMPLVLPSTGQCCLNATPPGWNG